MNPPSEDVKDMVTESNGIGTFGTDVFIAHSPPSPNECVTIYDTGGYNPDLATDIENPTVEFLVRGKVGGYKDAWSKADTIKSLLHGVHGSIVNGTRYILIRAVSDILFLGLDEKNRPELSINFSMMRTPSS